MIKIGINVILALMIIGSFLVATVLHAWVQALMASWLGDSTPRKEGRQSLSLRSHLDPLGTLLCVILALRIVIVSVTNVFAGPVGLGWGKPIKTDPWKLKAGPDLGTIIVAITGILVNLAIGLLFAFFLGLLPLSFLGNANQFTIRIPQLLMVFASVNISLAIVNLLPIYPLDGYQIVYALLPSRYAVGFAKSAPYGPFIILALFFLLPFLVQIAPALADFPLFRIPYYILAGAINLVSLVTGYNVSFLYIF